jgi:divalent metal cation (Fe/Co/Zn/Cd) transporter
VKVADNAGLEFWFKDVPLDAKILDIVKSVDGVKEVHNVSTHKSRGMTFSDLHVMVNKDINLLSAHKISEIIEQKIQENIPEIEHATIHLEPFVTVPKNFNLEDKIVEEEIRTVLEKYPEIKKLVV